MRTYGLFIADDFLENPEAHLLDVMGGEFEDFDMPAGVFKNIQIRKVDIVSAALAEVFPNYYCDLNIVRKSPKGQVEPNFIHSDENEGDLTAILYLSKSHPPQAGTTIYTDSEEKVAEVRMRFNRLFVFDSNFKHARNIYENFGDGDESRLVQVAFLKCKSDTQP